jgi:hypothetical protein
MIENLKRYDELAVAVRLALTEPAHLFQACRCAELSRLLMDKEPGCPREEKAVT